MLPQYIVIVISLISLGISMAKPTIISITPIIIAPIAFSLGPPGKLIQRVQFGFINPASPISITNVPVTKNILFAMFIF